MTDIKKSLIIANKNNPAYFHVGSGSATKIELISKDGAAVKSLYPNVQNPAAVAGLVLFEDRNMAGEIYLGTATVAKATASSAAGLPSWVGPVDATDEVIKVSLPATTLKYCSVGEIIRLTAAGIPDVYGRISVVGSTFVEIARVTKTTVDLTKLFTFTSAKAYLLLRDGKYGEPVSQSALKVTVINADTVRIDLSTTYKMRSMVDYNNAQQLILDMSPFVRGDVAIMGINNYGYNNVYFKVKQVLSDTAVIVSPPANFSLAGGVTSVQSDTSKNLFIKVIRSGNQGGIPETPQQVAENGTGAILKVDGVAAGLTEGDSCLVVIYSSDEMTPTYTLPA
ncbi:MAG: hypothetical protein ACRCY4_09450 [Brevinema sp.]